MNSFYLFFNKLIFGDCSRSNILTNWFGVSSYCRYCTISSIAKLGLITCITFTKTRHKEGLLKREEYMSDVWRPPWLRQQPWIFLNSFRDPYGEETWAWDDLDTDYPYRRMLARQDRKKTILVIKWLKVWMNLFRPTLSWQWLSPKKHPHRPQDIISHWEAYLFERFPETRGTPLFAATWEACSVLIPPS